MATLFGSPFVRAHNRNAVCRIRTDRVTVHGEPMNSRRTGHRRGAGLACAAFLVCSLSGATPARAADPPAGVAGPPPFEAPSVSDPLLGEPPAVPREIKSWDEALALLRAYAPDYVTAYQSVLRAEAQSRIALAAVLPTLTAQGSYTHQFSTESIPFGGAVLVVPPPDTFALTGTAMWNEPAWRVVMLEAPEVWGAQEISQDEVTMRMVVKTAPLRQWEVEREMRVRVKAALHEAGIYPAATAD